jgi:nucleoside triphosphate pyrophosphatase
MKKLVLASASKTRALMLTNAGVVFDIEPPQVDEAALKQALVADNVPPHDIADALAEMKARATSKAFPEALVIGADQILVQKGVVFSKAKDKAEASKVLQALSDNQHQLISAAVLYKNGQPVWRGFEVATLTVRPLSVDFINGYLDQLGDDAYWSVGCYQIEGLGAQLFTKLDGNHFTVLGLPLLPLLDYFRRAGYLML